MLLAGVDVSGRPDTGNYKFMSIVIGTEEKIKSLTGKLGTKHIHMHRIHDDKSKSKIISKLDFDGRQCVAFCYRVEFDDAVRKIKNMRRKRNIRKRRIYEACYYALWMLIQNKVKKFLQMHGCAVSDVVFQCDGDSEAFLKTVGLRHSKKGHAYYLSDIVAWANNRGREPHGTISVDLAGKIEMQVKLKIK